VLLLSVALPASGAWIEKESSSEPSASPGVVHRHVVLEEPESGSGATVELALFPAKSCQLRVIDNQRGASLAQAMQSARFAAGVNGGYFDTNFAPLGLRVINGKTTHSLAHGRLMSGILLCSNGATRIVRLSEFASKPKPVAAIESGPFLVDGARPMRGLEATRSARRTFVAVGGDRAALGLCSEISLSDLGNLLGHGLGDFKIQRALNLDGGSSSAFWFKRKDGSIFSISEEKTVRDFVGLAAP
jgi:uncharacterized protein YigE (DUF2233 family)